MKGRSSRYSFHSIFKLIAIVLILIFSLLAFYISKNTLMYKLEPIKVSGEKSLILYHDFDKDGFSEIVQTFYDAETKLAHIIISKPNSSPINEWDIQGYVSLKTHPSKRWIEFGDINDDKYDDVIVFAQENDSLFLFAIDVKNSENNLGKFLINRSFLLKKGDLEKKLPWDIYYNYHHIIDIDNDGKNELLFTVVSGYSKAPRGIYLYNFAQQKIIHRYETNATLLDMDFMDLTGDNKKEIIVSTYASNNFNKSVRQSDAYSWIFVFDANLNPLFPPKKLYGFTSGFKAIGVKEKNNSYILGFFSDTGKSNEPAKLVKIDSKGNIFKTLILSSSGKWDIKFYRIQDDSVIIIATNKSNNIYRYSKHFKLLRSISFPKKLIFYDHIDLNHDGTAELIAVSPFELLVYDANLHMLARTNIRTGNPHILVSIGNRGDFINKTIGLSTYGFQAIYNYKHVPFFKNKRIIIIFLNGLLLVLFLLYFYSQGSKISIKLKSLQLIQRTLNKGLLIIDDKGKIMYNNTMFLKLLNINESFKSKSNYNMVLSNHAEIIDLIQEAMKTKNEKKKTLKINGISHNIYISPYYIWPGCVSGYWIELNKITNHIDEKTKIWLNTIKKLAHDIKTPLSNIEVGVRTVKDSINQTRLKTKNLLMEDLDVLSYEVKRISNVIGNFLKFVNLEKPNFQHSDIHQCILKSVSNFDAYWKNNFTIDLEFDQNIPLFYFDPQQIEMVFNNLIKNSLDALHNHGKIIIRTNFLQDEISEIISQFCEIEITDNGPGIAPEKQKDIFNPNFSDKENGSGIGLTIVKKIIEDHKGEIKVFSTPGIGTTFRILLPILSSNGFENL